MARQGRTHLKTDITTPDGAIGQPGSSAARGSIVLLLSFGAVAGINYAFAITMSYLLPVNEYGLLGVMQTILLLGSTVIGAGFPWALTRVLATHNRPKEYASVFQAALIGNVFTGLLLCGLLILGTWQGWLPFGPQYRIPMLMACATITTLAVAAVFAAALQGLLRFGELGLTRLIEVVVKFVAGVIFVLLGWGINGALGAFLGAALISTLFPALALRNVPIWHIGDEVGTRLRELSRSVGPLFIGQLCLAALSNIDIIGLKLFSAADASDLLAGQYQAAITLTRIPIYLTSALMNAVFPFISRHSARTEIANVYATLALKYLFLFLVPLDLLFLILPDPLIRFFFSKAFDGSATPMAVAAAGTILLVLVYGLAILLQAAGQLRIQAWALPVTLAVEIVALRVLVPRAGTIGAGLALIGGGVCGLIFLLPATRHTYALHATLRGTLSYVAALATFVALLLILPQGSRLFTASAIVVAGGGYLLMLVILGLLTQSDITMLGGGFGPRVTPRVQRLARLVTWLGFLAPR